MLSDLELVGQVCWKMFSGIFLETGVLFIAIALGLVVLVVKATWAILAELEWRSRMKKFKEEEKIQRGGKLSKSDGSKTPPFRAALETS